jgi:hypothetical protein
MEVLLGGCVGGAVHAKRGEKDWAPGGAPTAKNTDLIHCQALHLTRRVLERASLPKMPCSFYAWMTIPRPNTELAGRSWPGDEVGRTAVCFEYPFATGPYCSRCDL